jgi:HK97 family phage major capsid protein
MITASDMGKSHELRRERMEVITEARKVSDSMAETRNASSEDKEKVNRMLARVDELDELIKTVESVETRSVVDTAIENRGRRGRISTGARGGDGADLLDTEEYRSAYRGWLRNGQFNFQAPSEYRDVVMGTNSAGGFLVTPTKISSDITQIINNLVYIRRMATVETVMDAQSLGVRQITTQPSDAAWTTEIGTTTADTAFAFGRRDLTPQLLAKLITVSLRMLETSRDVEPLVNERLAYKFAVAQENAFFNGSGSGQPLGVFTASANGIPTAQDFVVSNNSSVAFNPDLLVSARYQIKQPYLASKSAAWAFSRTAIGQIRLLKDSYGRYLWVDGGGFASAPDTIVGIPVMISEYCPSTFTAASYVGILGDWSYYRIADLMQMQIQRLTELFAGTHEVGFLGRQWLDGSPVLGEAFVRLQLHA